jgi:lipid A 3-O-deacylase
MSMKTKLFAALCLLPLATPAFAVDYLTGSVGAFDLVDGEDESAQFGVEYRMTPWKYGLRPTVGATVTADGGVYGYGGLNWDLQASPSIYIIPNFMAGLYAEGDSKDLGHAIEFRSGIEVAYQLQDNSRIGIAFNHISNASIGNKNPGAETLLINYSIPMGTTRY